jgi:hypothetical protein
MTAAAQPPLLAPFAGDDVCSAQPLVEVHNAGENSPSQNLSVPRHLSPANPRSCQADLGRLWGQAPPAPRAGCRSWGSERAGTTEAFCNPGPLPARPRAPPRAARPAAAHARPRRGFAVPRPQASQHEREELTRRALESPTDLELQEAVVSGIERANAAYLVRRLLNASTRTDAAPACKLICRPLRLGKQLRARIAAARWRPAP